MNNLYITYTPEEIELFKLLSPLKENLTATSKLIEISSKIPIFKDIPKTILIKILKDIKIIKYQTGEIIIKEGDEDETMYYILLGSVKVVKQNKLLTILQNGTLIGEMATLLKEKRTASIISATNNTTLISFKIDFNLFHTDLGYYFAIIYKNLSIELAKKLLKQNKQLIKN